MCKDERLIVFCVLCFVFCVLCFVFCVLCFVFCVFVFCVCVFVFVFLCFVFCVLCFVFCVLCFVFCVLCFVFCVFCVYVLCFVFCVLCFVFCVLCVLCFVFCVLCFVCFVCFVQPSQIVTVDVLSTFSNQILYLCLNIQYLIFLKFVLIKNLSNTHIHRLYLYCTEKYLIWFNLIFRDSMRIQYYQFDMKQPGDPLHLLKVVKLC